MKPSRWFPTLGPPTFWRPTAKRLSSKTVFYSLRRPSSLCRLFYRPNPRRVISTLVKQPPRHGAWTCSRVIQRDWPRLIPMTRQALRGNLRSRINVEMIFCCCPANQELWRNYQGQNAMIEKICSDTIFSDKILVRSFLTADLFVASLSLDLKVINFTRYSNKNHENCCICRISYILYLA